MARPVIEELTTSATNDSAALFKQLGVIIRGLQTQFSNNTYTSSRLDNKTEPGLKKGDVVIRFVQNVLKVGVWDGKRNRFLNANDLQSLQSHGTNFKGKYQNTVVVGNTAVFLQFPNIDDWGFYDRTSTGVLYLVYNYDGVALKSIALI